MYSWGGGACGQLGVETKSVDKDGRCYEPRPRVVEHLRPQRVSAIGCGQAHSVALANGRMYTWGAAGSGQLGHEMESFQSDQDGCPSQAVPREVELLKSLTVTAAACGNLYTLALTDGYVYAWGSDEMGQLGVKDILASEIQSRPDMIPIPQPVFGLEGIIQLTCGASHSLALDRDGRVYSWGCNSSGQLGTDDPRLRTDGQAYLATPSMVKALAEEKIRDVAAGEAHSLAVSLTGNLYSWGSCSSGQLSHEGFSVQLTPCLVTCLRHAVLQVACGSVHNLAITESEDSVASSLASLVDNEMLADIAFQCTEGGVLYAHSCLLKHHAPSLHAYSTSCARKKVRSRGKQLPLVPMATRKEVLRDLMHYVYTQDVESATMSLPNFPAVLELYHLGVRFEMPMLLRRCRKLIQKKLGKQNLNKNGTLRPGGGFLTVKTYQHLVPTAIVGHGERLASGSTRAEAPWLPRARSSSGRRLPTSCRDQAGAGFPMDF